MCFLPVNAAATPKAGDMAIEFNLKEVDGQNKYSMKDFNGKLVMLNLWAGWCIGCKEEMPHFIDLQESFNKDDFMIVAASLDRNEEDTVNFLKDLERRSGKKVNFLVLIDEDKVVAKGYDPFGLPATFLIDGNGKIIKAIYGSLNNAPPSSPYGLLYKN